MASFTVIVSLIVLDYGFCVAQATRMGYFRIITAGELGFDFYLARFGVLLTYVAVMNENPIRIVFRHIDR
jgi:hypothetical protein